MSNNYHTLLAESYIELRKLKAQLKSVNQLRSEPIAIIGMACRFPNAPDPESFWKLLCERKDAVKEVPLERWDWKSYFDENPNANKTYSKWGGFIESIDQFDPLFFNISPREAELMDPQQRLFLEIAWETLEDAAFTEKKLEKHTVGVFVGSSNNGYYNLIADNLTALDHTAGIGNQNAIIANRISYFFNLKGPSLLVDTMCSSSLVAVHLACQSLRNQECTAALAGGVNVLLSPEYYVAMSRMKSHSPDGQCKTFDHKANGIVLGEGAGAVLLKPLQAALEAGDRIYAVIRGSAINHGGASNGLTSPNPSAQSELICRALENSNLSAADISYVEAHGTGTSLGDPIEIEGLTRAFRKYTDLKQFCAIGSVKTNIGHLEPAAGIASLIKVVLSMQHRQLPPTIHFEKPNPFIPFKSSPFKVNSALHEWNTEGLRRAGISSFGMGGVNAHLICEEMHAEVKHPIENDRDLHFLALSTKSEAALKDLALNYKKLLSNDQCASVADICFSANTGRTHFPFRAGLLASSKLELQKELNSLISGDDASLINKNNTADQPKSICFLFTGQGSQYPGMGYDLYRTQPSFRQIIDKCDKVLRDYIDVPLLSILYPVNGAANLLNETIYTQPALYTFECALFELWKSWGIKPTMVFGHSLGEYAAAYAAGIFSLEDGLRLVAARAKLMNSLPKNGEMAAIFSEEEHVAKVIRPYLAEVSIAAINGPRNVVISGARDRILHLIEYFRSHNIESKLLEVSHAFHSPLMSSLLNDFEKETDKISFSLPHTGIVSNITGELVSTEMLTSKYWSQHLLQPVQFYTAIRNLSAKGIKIFIEIGPKPTLLAMGHQCLPKDTGIWLPSIREARNPWQQLLQSLRQLYMNGIQIDWVGFDKDYPRSLVSLPSYPFQRQCYWPKTVKKTGAIQPLATLNDQRYEKPGNIKDWLYQVEWQPENAEKESLSAEIKSKPGTWLILADKNGVAQSLSKLLQKKDQHCYLVYAGDKYQNGERLIINPSEPEDFECLYQDILKNLDFPLKGIVNLWSLEAPAAEHMTIQALKDAQVMGCGSTLHLLQTLIRHYSSDDISIWVATQGTVPAGNDYPLSVAQAPLWGMSTVIGLEYPQFWGGIIDFGYNIKADEIAMFASEILGSHGEDQLAIHNGQRYVPRLIQTTHPGSYPSISFKPDKSYIITGGLGGIGIKVAEWIVQKGGRYLILIGRSEASKQAKETLNKLQQAGAEILTIQANIGDEHEMNNAIRKIRSTMPELKGIIHAAGIAKYRSIEEILFEDFETVLLPKVYGTWLLHQATQFDKLDFFISFSSMLSILGAQRLVDYGAANSFLDVFAHFRKKLQLPALTVNWGPWDGGGMASAEFKVWLNRMGIEAFAPDEGIEALDFLLASNVTQSAAFKIDWSIFKKFYEARRPKLLLSSIKVTSKEERGEATVNFLEQLKGLSLRDQRKIISSYLQTQVTRLLKMDATYLWDVNQPLNELGIDSLMSIELKNRLATELKVDVNIEKLIIGANISKLSEIIINKLVFDNIILLEPAGLQQNDDMEELIL